MSDGLSVFSFRLLSISDIESEKSSVFQDFFEQSEWEKDTESVIRIPYEMDWVVARGSQ